MMGILLTASVASATKPEGTVIKGGVLTYPGGPYLEEELPVLDFNTRSYDSQAHMFGVSNENVCLGKWWLPLFNMEGNRYLSDNPDAEGYCTRPCNLLGSPLFCMVNLHPCTNV